MKYFGAFLIICLYGLSSCQSNETGDLTVAAASSMQFVMEDLVADYEKNFGIKTTVILNSSGKLTAQIKEGAPYDVFLSADLKFPKELQNAGVADSVPQVFAYGQLAWWSADKLKFEKRLTANQLHSVAIANPRTAPYGRAAVEHLASLNWMDSLSQKFVYGESISQTNQFILSGAAEVGITAKSIMFSDRISEIGSWKEIEPTTYSSIPQSCLCIRRLNKTNKQAAAFCRYLFSEKARVILKDYGYLLEPGE